LERVVNSVIGDGSELLAQGEEREEGATVKEKYGEG